MGASTSTVAYSELGPHVHSLRTGRWHYILNPRGYSSPGARPQDDGHAGRFTIATEELYDVLVDPRETRNLVAEEPEVARGLRARLEAWVARGGETYEGGEIPEEARKELRALGY